jgi:type I restriction enzyme S subunit
MNVFAWEGAVAVAGPREAGKIGSHRFATYTPINDVVDPSFLQLYFRTAAGREVLGRVSPGSAGRNRTMNLVALAKELVPLPRIDEQRRLVARIEAIAAKIAEARRMAIAISNESDALLHMCFRKFAENVPKRRLGDVAPLVRRPAIIDISKVYPQVSVRSFGRGTFHSGMLDGSDITWEKPHLVKAGDVLISNIKAWEGAIAVVAKQDDARYGSHRYLTYVPISDLATPCWVCFHLLTPEGLYMVGEASPGSADRNRTTSAKALLEIPIPIPPYEHQLKFGDTFAKVEVLKRYQQNIAAKLDALLPSVLDRAFNGDL